MKKLLTICSQMKVIKKITAIACSIPVLFSGNLFAIEKDDYLSLIIGASQLVCNERVTLSEFNQDFQKVVLNLPEKNQLAIADAFIIIEEYGTPEQKKNFGRDWLKATRSCLEKSRFYR